MMRLALQLSFTAALAGVGVAHALPAQSAPASLPTPLAGSQVYVSTVIHIRTFAGPSDGAASTELTALAQLSVKYAFLALSGARLEDGTPATCVTDSAARTTRSAPRRRFGGGPSVFLVAGSVLRAQVDTQYLVRLQVWRCGDGEVASIWNASRAMTRRTAYAELQILAEAAAARVRSKARPAVRLEVGSTTSVAAASGTDAMARGSDTNDRWEAERQVATAAIADQIAATERYDLSDSTADYVLRVQIDGARAMLSVTRAGEQSPASTSVVERLRRPLRPDEPLQSFYETAGWRALALLEETVYPALGTAKLAPVAFRTDSAVAIARHSLCLATTVPGACQAAPDAALSALTAISPRDTARADVRAVRGRALLARGDVSEGVALLAAALGTSTGAEAISEQERVELHRMLAAGYRAAGNYSGAAETVTRLAERYPLDSSLILERAQALRLAGRRDAAVAVLDSMLQRWPRNPPADSELVAVVSESSIREVAAGARNIVRACGRSDATRQRCGAVLMPLGMREAQAGRFNADTRNVLLATHELLGVGRGERWRLATALAATYIGVVDARRDRSGILRFSAPQFVEDSARLWLARADSSGTATSDVDREWLLRLQGYYWALRDDPARAATLAASARRERESRDGVLLEVNAHLALATMYRARVASDSSPSGSTAVADSADAQVRMARAALDAGLGRLGNEPSLVSTLSGLCVDYAFDFTCAAGVARARLAGERLTTPRQYLAVAEAAILGDDSTTALRALGALQVNELAGCDAAVGALLWFWAVGQFRPADAPAQLAPLYGRWRTGTLAHRASDGRPCWVFEGERVRLRRTPAVANAVLLARMIAALEDASVPIPARLPATAAQ